MTPTENSCACAENAGEATTPKRCCRATPTQSVSTPPLDTTGVSTEVKESASSPYPSLYSVKELVAQAGRQLAEYGMSHPEASENLALAVANLTLTKIVIDHELRREGTGTDGAAAART